MGVQVDSVTLHRPIATFIGSELLGGGYLPCAFPAPSLLARFGFLRRTPIGMEWHYPSANAGTGAGTLLYVLYLFVLLAKSKT